MELLAPVGSKEAFITAVRAGADAVYMGVPDFNARASASNINLFDIAALIGHAHSKNIKVFLALNTLIKHEEINDAVKRIAYIEKLFPDAVIVQDLGIADIIRKYFPDIPLHASTQMAVHNRMGADFLAKVGFKRVIMARELTFSELKIIAGGTPVELELFCHGALCFALSGLCLFSSFIGGLSGNRGRCTQPCRRLWKNGDKKGYLFSPKDLELAEFIPKLKNIGITSLKIEGRLRSSEYVFKTVKAYRMLIDAPENDFAYALKEAKIILSGDTGRQKTTCLFSGRDNDMFQPKMAQCLGNTIGRITNISGENLTIELIDNNLTICSGDRLRIVNPATDVSISFTIKEFSINNSKYVIPFSKSSEFECGNTVFKILDSVYDQKNIETDIDSIYAEYKKSNRKKPDDQMSQKYTALISNKWKEFKNSALSNEADDVLWIKIDNILWLNLLPQPAKNIHYVFYLSKENLHFADKIPGSFSEDISCELPPFIGQRDIPVYKQCIQKMAGSGINKWILNNVSHFELFKGLECRLSAGPFLYTWNAYTAAFLTEIGINYFTVSWEDDFLNIRKLCSPGLGKYLIVYLYGFIPLIRSRMLTKEMISDELITNYSQSSTTASSFSFMPAFESGLTVLLPEKPFSIFHARKKLNEYGINNFGIDLSYIKPDKKIFDTIKSEYDAYKNSIDSTRFNFKRCIK